MGVRHAGARYLKSIGSSKCMGRTRMNCYSVSSAPQGTDSGTCICRGL